MPTFDKEAKRHDYHDKRHDKDILMDYNKDINSKGLISQQSANGMEAFSITLSKKCERLATAVYLVTNFLLDTEPLKSRLRTLSLDFVRDASFARVGGHTTEGHSLDVLRSNILETLALLELAFISGLLSEMNFSILKKEYALLRDSIEIKKASHESRTDNILGDTFFGTSFHSPEVEDKDTVFKGHNNTSMSFKMSDRDHVVPKVDLGSSKRPDLGQSESKPKTVLGLATSASSSSALDHDSRRARILKLVKDNKEVMVKDITVLFPNLSEKTLQRELAALVEGGVLKKTGDRRWSRYSLI